MIVGWVLILLVLALAFVALVLYQRAETTTSRIVTGVTAMILGVPGLVWLAMLVLS